MNLGTRYTGLRNFSMPPPESPTPMLTLNNGEKMPQFGLGTFELHDGEIVEKNITDNGYRMLDCASFYKNEMLMGDAITMCLLNGMEREEIFVTSKVWMDEVEDVEAACYRSLEALGLK